MSDEETLPGDRELDPEFRIAGTAAQANEWALVLTSAGIPSRVVRGASGFALQVHKIDAVRAATELEAYEAENLEAAEPANATAEVEEYAPGAALNAALLVSLAMVGFYAVTGPSRPQVAWFSEGSASALAIRAGEIWRTVSALTLHADGVHLIANLLFGTFFLAAVGRSLGPGVGFGLVLLSGAAGNFLNAFLRSSSHVSIGASTAVFGAVGLLAGLGIAHRALRGERWRRVFVPFAAGLGVLAMIGSGEGRVDVFAHLFGLLAGVVLGAAAGLAMRRPPPGWAQLVWAGAAIASLIGSWKLALA